MQHDHRQRCKVHSAKVTHPWIDGCSAGVRNMACCRGATLHRSERDQMKMRKEKKMKEHMDSRGRMGSRSQEVDSTEQ